MVEDSFPRLLFSWTSRLGLLFLLRVEEYLAVLADVAMFHLNNAWWMHKLSNMKYTSHDCGPSCSSLASVRSISACMPVVVVYLVLFAVLIAVSLSPIAQ